MQAGNEFVKIGLNPYAITKRRAIFFVFKISKNIKKNQKNGELIGDLKFFLKLGHKFCCKLPSKAFQKTIGVIIQL